MLAQLTTLHDLAAYAPQESADVLDVAADLGLSRSQGRLFHRVHGLDRLRQDPDQHLFDLLCAPARTVVERVADHEDIRYLIYAHTIQQVTPAGLDPATRIAELLGLPDAEAFSLTQQGCAGGLAAVDAAGELLRADGDPAAKALVVTGEKAFSKLARLIDNTAIMGEASAACLVGIGGGPAVVRGYAVRTDGRFSHGIRMTPQAVRDFGESYPADLAAVIQEALAEAATDLSELTAVIPHNVNRSSWLRVIKELGVDKQLVYLDNIPRYSHCFCVDPFLNLVTLREQGRLAAGGRYLLTAVGLGATYAAMVIDMVVEPATNEEASCQARQ
ncbi:ketoacyl-ACP synthase III family protein [Catenulispora sp. NF23]|uniref:Ketoacyl-ACP synthase III family protein n=1 Tax=Catenulispora pinistramenti TaxID=2705254 RepID=A0ABS5KPC8_9ACTN|nr:ketoacyl-ACP synthase III family protein [Catenulispora pinistramenti]MBS2532713.1 ketoacyl-ACP synthase III family protein [Catenulispora pinistramenti]MBS2547870.1 ketoacyl-ACP synthase III family protein [Catenulispora pinistramenti]